MKNLKKSPVILLLTLLTVIIGSWTFAPGFSDWSLFDNVKDADLAKGEDNALNGVDDELGIKTLKDNPTTINTNEPEKNSVIFQSNDRGQTWLEIGRDLPELEQFVGFFAGESEVYLRTNGVTYRSKSNLKTPIWEKVNIPSIKNTSIAFNPSGVMAYTYDGSIYQKQPSSETWLPIYTNLKNRSVQSIFEASNGTIFLSSGKGLYKSYDKGQSWEPSQKSYVGNIVESEGVLLASGQEGIMRSTDNGENWELVISEGGVGIAIERIDGGFAAITYSSSTKSRRIRVSYDEGKTWKAIDMGLKTSKNITSIKQVGSDLFVGHSDGIFRSPDMGKSWKLVHESVDNEVKVSAVKWIPSSSEDIGRVFELHVSNNVLYAVARKAGC